MQKSIEGNKIQLKFINQSYLYNMLQDFRHLIVFDFRDNYQENYIRDSFHITKNILKQNIREVIELAEKKNSEKQNKYKTIQKVRRYFFVDQQKVDPNNPMVQLVLECLEEYKCKEDKYYALNDNFDKFAKTYPFTCLQEKKIKQMMEKGDHKQSDKILLYPYAKFPSEIITNKLYLGNVYSSNSERQLEDLQIKSLFDFIYYNEEQIIPEFKTTQNNPQYYYKNIPISTQANLTIEFDFDIINSEIDQQIEKNHKVLLYCQDGQTISAAFAISYLMYKAKLDVTMATLKVCQAISRVQINKMVYSQLLLYKPKK